MRSILAFLLFSSVAVAQTTWYVDAAGFPPGTGTQADPYTSIQFALDEGTTMPGDMVLVLPGTYFENVYWQGKAVSLVSAAGAEATVIDGGGVDACMTINGANAPLFEGFTLTNGSAFVGGGLRVMSSDPLVRSCIIRGNTASGRGGGVWIAYDSPVFERCVIADNVVTGPSGQGGGMYSMYGFTMSIVNCTFTRTSAAQGAGYKSDFSTGATIVNSIFWGNSGADLVPFESTVAVTHCDVGGGFAGAGNLDANPRFRDAAAGDWRLKPGSPCIDAGDPIGPPDPDGSVADIGARTTAGRPRPFALRR